MAFPLPLLLLAGGALILGKKKKPKRKVVIVEEEVVEEEVIPSGDEEVSEETADEGAGDDEALQFGKVVASGIRRDKRGSHQWRIKYEEDGYHAQLLMGGRMSPVTEEFGTAATLRAAKELIRDALNERLLSAGYKESDLTDEPAPRALILTGTPTGGDGDDGGGMGGLAGG